MIDRIADAAPRLTTGQLRARLRKLCLEADPEDAVRRYDEAVAAETRTMDQLRADVLIDLLTGRNVTGRGGVVDIHVDLATLAKLSEAPGDLAGYGPVIADIARQVADEQERSEWRFLVTDPGTGEPVHAGITRRRPTAPLKVNRIHLLRGVHGVPRACKRAHEADREGEAPAEPLARLRLSGSFALPFRHAESTKVARAQAHYR